MLAVVAGAIWAAPRAHAQESIAVDSVILKLVEQADVPAQQAGVLQEIPVREGDLVQIGQCVAQIDDQSSRLATAKAEADLAIAERLARDKLQVEIAQRAADQATQKLSELRLQQEMAAKQAENIFRVEASEKAQAVAENELTRARLAKQRYDDSVSQSEIDGLLLEAEKASLEAKQARFEKEIDALKREVAAEQLEGQELALVTARLEIAQAEAEQEAALLQAELKRRELDLAKLDLERRRIVSPLDGVVVELYQHRGEWVEPGQPVMRILRLNRLWAEGFIRVDDLSKCVESAPVQLTVPLGAEETAALEGRIVFIGREVDPVNRELLIRAEFENEDLRLLPGMEGTMQILAQRPNAADAATAVPARGAALKKLEKEIDADFSGPLQSAVESISKQSGVPISIDGNAFKNAGFTKNMPVRMALGKATSLEALQLIADEVDAHSPEGRLCLVFHEQSGAATLTTEAFASRMEQDFHPLLPKPGEAEAGKQ
jgi:macrolide-specific efflux system membrane fusion protein